VLTVLLVLTRSTAFAAGDPGSTGTAPAVVYIWYADGGPAPSESACAGKTPPAYSCSFGQTIKDCKRLVQDFLDQWYADLNVVFTYNRPTAGEFFTVIVTSDGGAWCSANYDDRVGGVAPISCDRVLGGGTCYAFQCGRDAKSCATIIAQEQAHLVGLEHTSSPADAMYVYVSAASNGFEDRENPVSGSVCSRQTQNSLAQMRSRLGVWPGGPKPDPFVNTVSGTVPAVAVYQGELQGSAYGCAIARSGQGAPDSRWFVSIVLMVFFGAARSRSSARRSRRNAR
jgi:hypothetical protein